MPSTDAKALLATDLVDSTGITERVGKRAAAELWSAHDRLARDLLVRWRGHEIDKTDGFLLLFDEARCAAGYALDYHRAIAGLPHPLAARAGLHVAPIVLRPNTPGDVARGAKPVEIDDWLPKATVARAMALAPGGRTLLTPQAAAELRSAAGDEPRHERLQLATTGHWRLQGLAEPIELFCLHDTATDRGPIPDTAKAQGVVRQGERWVTRHEIRHTLPAERDSFIGRRDALQEVAERLAAGSRLVSVLGAGGTGKTRLALRFGRDRIGDFPGGVWFCDLSGAQGSEGLLYAVAQGLELRLSGADPAGQIGVAIAGRARCLVVLDNFEQVAACAEATVGRWLSSCPEAAFLVTSRSALRLFGESQLRLGPLTAHEAAALFRQRARDGGAEPLENPGDAESIDTLVGLLDGLPLALELAAARAKVLRPAALVARMTQRFWLLASSSGRPGRQATLRATLDWSWDLLDDASRSALAQLSVFEGGFDLADVEAVVALPAGADAMAHLDLLQSLLEHSMVRKAPFGRFDLIQSIHEYAAEQLVAAGAFDGSGPALRGAGRARHWAHFASFDERRAAADAGAALENLIAACRRASDAAEGAPAAGALRAVWAVLRLTGPFREAAALARRVEALPGLAAVDRCTAQRILAEVHDLLGEAEGAHGWHQAALASAEAAADPAARAWARWGYGQHLYRRGDAAAARVALDESFAIALGLDDPAVLCPVQMALGTLEMRLGRSAEARRHYQEALGFARVLGDARLEGGILGNLAALAHEEASDAAAQAQYEQALALTRQVGDRRWEGNTRCNLGLLLQDRGLRTEAEAEFGKALAIALEIGHPMLEATLRCNLGILNAGRGDLEAACAHHQAAVRLAIRVDDPRAEGQFRGFLGDCHAMLGRPAEALRELDAAQRCLESAGDRTALGLLLCQRARFEHRFGAAGASTQALDLARGLFAETGSGELGHAIDETTRTVLGVAV